MYTVVCNSDVRCGIFFSLRRCLSAAAAAVIAHINQVTVHWASLINTEMGVRFNQPHTLTQPGHPSIGNILSTVAAMVSVTAREVQCFKFIQISSHRTWPDFSLFCLSLYFCGGFSKAETLSIIKSYKLKCATILWSKNVTLFHFTIVCINGDQFI